MPREAKGPRLYRPKNRTMWYIRDTGRPERSTGESCRSEAEKVLARYIFEKDRPSGSTRPEDVNVADALTYYIEHHVPTIAAPERILYAINALLPFWENLKAAEVRGETCRQYARRRTNPIEGKPVTGSTVRRELNALQAALNLYHKEGYLLYAPKVTKPKEGERVERYLTRSEVAKLLWGCRNSKRRHLMMFILVGVYTGTRHDAILSLMFEPNTAGGWIDLEKGLIYRKGEGQTETVKKRTTAKLPQKLLAHLRRCKGRYVVDIDGQRVGNIRKAFYGARTAAKLDNSVTPHVLKHTAITWGMQNGMEVGEAASYFSTSIETIQKHYWHHSPDYQSAAAAAMDKRTKQN